MPARVSSATQRSPFDSEDAHDDTLGSPALSHDDHRRARERRAPAPPCRRQAGPWAQRPPGNPGSVNFVVWQYGKIYEQIAKQFEDDWGVKVQQIIEPNVEPQVAKLTAMFAANEPVDVSQSPIQYLASHIEQGIAQPIDGLPGVEQYVRDFTPFTRAIAQRDGRTWGLPYFSTVWTFMYNDELLTKAGFKDKPFKSYPELVEQAKKAKNDGVSKYPILWIGGQGFEQLPGTWFSMVASRGGVIFDKQLAPQLGAGSVARETLKWWAATFKDELADPSSLNLRFIPAVKAFNAGQHVYLGTLHHYYVSLINDDKQSPIAGKGRVLGHPGDGKTIGYTMLYIMPSTTKHKNLASGAAPRTASTRRPIAWPPTRCSAAATSRSWRARRCAGPGASGPTCRRSSPRGAARRTSPTSYPRSTSRRIRASAT